MLCLTRQTPSFCLFYNYDVLKSNDLFFCMNFQKQPANFDLLKTISDSPFIETIKFLHFVLF